ncbi:DNA polymerase III subunit gamma/tau [Rubrivirga sp.]|uniref:DNA polymerase III subunit gamma/tau n=1 Tax=Rubrivirga sp. TaxID=1885344 RepID=UPI003B51B420
MADTTRASGARFTVTARKYRPQTFDDLVAQEHVAETLRNAITRDRLAHAYLFSGPRGVGKTTAARILAKAVNCQTPLAERPAAEPCRTCASCVAFEDGRSLNIIEIDAASNNRVEDIRELRDTVRVPPQGAKKKVYILDEVHMLSASAFNALLKTLEEPPDYALFIFATTEPHKVLPTILSRTQRFDFRRIAVPEIVDRLREICTAEGVAADDESLVLLARKGDGALRDALSLFDQAVSLCGADLEIGPLREALGVVDADVYFEATARAQRGDRAALLSLVDHVVRSGHDLNEFVLGLADHLRNLLVARSTGTGDLIEGTEATRQRYLDAAASTAEADLLHLLMLAETAATDLRESRQPRLTLELALLKMASLERAADLGRLLDRLAALEQAARTGTLPPSPLTEAAAPARTKPEPPPPAPPTSAPTDSVSPQPAVAGPAVGRQSPSGSPPPEQEGTGVVDQGDRVPAAERSTPQATSAPSVATAQASPSSAPAARLEDREEPPATARTAEPPGSYSAPSAHRPDPGGDPRPEPPPPAEAPAPPRLGPDDDGGQPAEPPPPRPPSAPPAQATPSPAPRPRSALFGSPALKRPAGGDGSTGPADLHAGGDGQSGPSPAVADPLGPALARVTDAWPAFVAAVREHVGVRVGAIVKAGTPFRVARGAVEVGMNDAFAVTVASDNQSALADVLAGVLGADAPPLRWVESPRETAETARPDDPFEALKQMRQDHPVVRALFEQFGAEIVWS